VNGYSPDGEHQFPDWKIESRINTRCIGSISRQIYVWGVRGNTLNVRADERLLYYLLAGIGSVL
jgi:hypothetical protein